MGVLKNKKKVAALNIPKFLIVIFLKYLWIFIQLRKKLEAEEIPILDWGEKHYHALFVT